jgi:hypothetical protein
MCKLVGGIMSMIGSLIPLLVIPALIGTVIDAMNKKDLDAVGKNCLYMALVILVTAIFALIRAFTFTWINKKII